MKRLAYILCLATVAVASFLFGTRQARQPSASTPGAEFRKVLYYVDPMNPAHTSDGPGLAPCGMKMEPVYADSDAGRGQGGQPPTLPGTVRISTEKQQLMGVRVGVAEQQKYRHRVRLLGRVAIDETRVYKITATVNGWVTKTMPYASGDFVKRHDVLAAFYSPEFLSAGQALLYALNTRARVETNEVKMPEPGSASSPPDDRPAEAHEAGAHEAASHEATEHVEVLRRSRLSRLSQFNVNIQQYVESLKNLGMGEVQIQEMIRTRKFTPNVDITAPADAVITVRNLAEGQRFEKNEELYRLADLTKVWILADMFGPEAEQVEAGMQARVTVLRLRRSFTATVSKALPQFDNTSRTLKLRLEADNPDYLLKPDMFVDVDFAVELPETLVVPADAVLDAGLRKSVFVARGDGVFEPRPVQTGWQHGDQVQILEGLHPGEEIVISGNFLLDSESRMKLAAAGVHGASAVDPVCGMTVDERTARVASRLSQHQGQTYYFCNEMCKQQFDANPGKYTGGTDPKPAAAAEAQPARATDPVCGMKVIEVKARAAKRFSEYQGKTYYFCNDSCKQEFDAGPAKYVGAAGAKSGDVSHKH